jgi:hypothetical protein
MFEYTGLSFMKIVDLNGKPAIRVEALVMPAIEGMSKEKWVVNGYKCPECGLTPATFYRVTPCLLNPNGDELFECAQCSSGLSMHHITGNT